MVLTSGHLDLSSSGSKMSPVNPGSRGHLALMFLLNGAAKIHTQIWQLRNPNHYKSLNEHFYTGNSLHSSSYEGLLIAKYLRRGETYFNCIFQVLLVLS